MPRVAAPVVDDHHDGLEWASVTEHVSTAIGAKLADPAALASDPQGLRDSLDEAIAEGIRLALDASALRWAEGTIGAARYEHAKGRRRTHLSGSRDHTVTLSVGPVTFSVPKPRTGSSRPWWVPALKALPQPLERFVRELWLRGLSTRDLSAVSAKIAGREYSHSKMAEVVKDVAHDALRWLNRPIGKEIRYLVFDGLYVPVIRQTSRKEAILVALGITADGRKQVLDVLHAPSESADSWSTLIGRLLMRGLDTSSLSLVITDGDEGLLGAVRSKLPNVRRQRCVVHKVRNVVGRSPKSLKGVAPKEASAIFKAPSRDQAQRRAKAFVTKYGESHPSLANVIRDDLDACLAFYDLDANLWKSLRSTNALERLNRELRRKFREVGAMRADVNVMRIAVQVAAFLNEQMKDQPIAGFKQTARRQKRKSAPKS